MAASFINSPPHGIIQDQRYYAPPYYYLNVPINNGSKSIAKMHIVHPNACNIDLGSKFHIAAIGLEYEQVKEFGVYPKTMRT